MKKETPQEDLIDGRRGPKAPTPQVDPTEDVEERQEIIDERKLGDNKGTGCLEVVLGTLAIGLLLFSLLACAASTYSSGVPTQATIQAQATITEARNAAAGIVPVGTLEP